MQDFSSVNNKVAIVTGSSRGIGKSIAKTFAANGMKVVCAARSVDKGQQVVDEIKAAGGEAIFRRTDCSNPGDISELVGFAVEHFGQLDGIVSNAGIGMGGTPVHEYTLDDYEKVMNLNLKGVFAGMKYAAEAILKSSSQSGFIINVASIAGLMPQRGQALYTATKFAVVGMTRTASLDYAPHNITVNAICPGYTQTSMFDGIPEQAMDYFLNDAPSGRLGEPEECAYLALFLASDMARYISGAAIPVDGALAAGSKNVIAWQHPEILTGGKIGLNSNSTVGAIMDDARGAAVLEKYLPGFGANEDVKMANSLTIRALCELPMLGMSQDKAQEMFEELDALS